jgi:hypothetical protein
MTGTNMNLILSTMGNITNHTPLNSNIMNLTIPNGNSLTFTGGNGLGSAQIGTNSPLTGSINIDLAPSSLLNIKTDNASAYINAKNSLPIGQINVGTASVNLTASSGSIINNSNASNIASANIIAGADSVLKAMGQADSTLGTKDAPLWIDMSGGTLTVTSMGEQDGVSVDIHGTMQLNNGFIKAGSFLGDVIFNQTSFADPKLSNNTTANVQTPVLLNCEAGGGSGEKHGAGGGHQCSVTADSASQHTSTAPDGASVFIHLDTLPSGALGTLLLKTPNTTSANPEPISKPSSDVRPRLRLLKQGSQRERLSDSLFEVSPGMLVVSDRLEVILAELQMGLLRVDDIDQSRFAI